VSDLLLHHCHAIAINVLSHRTKGKHHPNTWVRRCLPASEKSLYGASRSVPPYPGDCEEAFEAQGAAKRPLRSLEL
jgi:hypothetical protein